jgi:hypothetical protein
MCAPRRRRGGGAAFRISTTLHTSAEHAKTETAVTNVRRIARLNTPTRRVPRRFRMAENDQ